MGKLLAPLLGGHRTLSHSLIGLFLGGYLADIFLTSIRNILIVDIKIVWFSFMIGFISHLFTDSLTKEGIPLLFPLPIQIGLPPIRSLRITTGKIIEKSLIFPGLMILNFYIYSQNYHKLLTFLKDYIN